MLPEDLIEADLTRSVIAAFFEVYNTLGFGFLEHIYVSALERELRDRGHNVARELGVWVMYKGQHLATQRLDLVVDGKLIIEQIRAKPATCRYPTAVQLPEEHEPGSWTSPPFRSPAKILLASPVE